MGRVWDVCVFLIGYSPSSIVRDYGCCCLITCGMDTRGVRTGDVGVVDPNISKWERITESDMYSWSIWESDSVEDVVGTQ